MEVQFSAEAVEASMKVTEASTTSVEASTTSIESFTASVEASMEPSSYFHEKSKNAPDPASGTDILKRVLDVLTPLSDCTHETVEKIMERRISGVSYMCWMDFHNTFLCCGFYVPD